MRTSRLVPIAANEQTPRNHDNAFRHVVICNSQPVADGSATANARRVLPKIGNYVRPLRRHGATSCTWIKGVTKRRRAQGYGPFPAVWVPCAAAAWAAATCASTWA